MSGVRADGFGHDDGRQPGFGVIDKEEWNGGDERDRQFVAPTDVKDVVQESEHGCGKEGEDGGKVEGELERNELTMAFWVAGLSLPLDGGMSGFQRILRVCHR